MLGAALSRLSIRIGTPRPAYDGAHAPARVLSIGDEREVPAQLDVVRLRTRACDGRQLAALVQARRIAAAVSSFTMNMPGELGTARRQGKAR